MSNKNNTDWMNKSTTKERTNERNRGKENVYQRQAAQLSIAHSTVEHSVVPFDVLCSYTCIFMLVEIVTCGLIFKWSNNVDEESVCSRVYTFLRSLFRLLSLHFISFHWWIHQISFVISFYRCEIAMLWTIIMRHRKTKEIFSCKYHGN